MRWHRQKTKDPFDPFDGLDEVLKAQGHTGLRFKLLLIAIFVAGVALAILSHR
jgi:hypothetical protein